MSTKNVLEKLRKLVENGLENANWSLLVLLPLAQAAGGPGLVEVLKNARIWLMSIGGAIFFIGFLAGVSVGYMPGLSRTIREGGHETRDRVLTGVILLGASIAIFGVVGQVIDSLGGSSAEVSTGWK